MEIPKTLRHGRAFEKELFGVTEEEDFIDPNLKPSSRSYERSLKVIIDQVWAEYAEATCKGLDAYDPTNPIVGKTPLIFRAVKKHLPRRVNGRSSFPLNMFIAVGRTSLDWQHGVDAFFVWEGVIVTFDASTRVKDPVKLKADFLFLPSDLGREKLDKFGKNVADLLRYKRKHNRPPRRVQKVLKRKSIKIDELSD